MSLTFRANRRLSRKMAKNMAFISDGLPRNRHARLSTMNATNPSAQSPAGAGFYLRDLYAVGGL
jgi:hypothetical protein